MNVYWICGDLPTAGGRGVDLVERVALRRAQQHHRGAKEDGQRFGARVVVLEPLSLAPRSARVSQQSLEMPRGWALFAATIAV
jgi:hypothetical protein